MQELQVQARPLAPTTFTCTCCHVVVASRFKVYYPLVEGSKCPDCSMGYKLCCVPRQYQACPACFSTGYYVGQPVPGRHTLRHSMYVKLSYFYSCPVAWSVTFSDMKIAIDRIEF